MDAPARVSPAEHRVLDHLKRAGRARAQAIARTLRVTPMAVRHHLAVLERAGLVQTTRQRRGVGRPVHLYSLTATAEAFFPKRYGDFARNLLRHLAAVDGEAKVARLFQRMKNEAVAGYAPRLAGKSLRARVAAVARLLTEAGYMADWKQVGPRTFQLTERNCAISCVAQECRYACESELALLQALLGAGVERQEHMLAGDPCCSYRIQPAPLSPSVKKEKPRGGR